MHPRTRVTQQKTSRGSISSNVGMTNEPFMSLPNKNLTAVKRRITSEGSFGNGGFRPSAMKSKSVKVIKISCDAGKDHCLRFRMRLGKWQLEPNIFPFWL